MSVDSAVSVEGLELTWETRFNNDGITGFKLNGKEYSLVMGRMFVVTRVEDEFVVTQHTTDISKLKIAHLSDLRRKHPEKTVIKTQPVDDVNKAELLTLLEADEGLKGRFMNLAKPK